MSDLISRRGLIKHFEAVQSQECAIGLDFVAIIDEIKEQPTAYDIDKVVEELEGKKEKVQRMRNTCVSLSDLEVCNIENVTYERAIEIVKQGGVGKLKERYQDGFDRDKSIRRKEGDI